MRRSPRENRIQEQMALWGYGDHQQPAHKRKDKEIVCARVHEKRDSFLPTIE